MRLKTILLQIKHSGVVAACGLAGGMELKGATVAPFILRGVTLRGVDSVFQNMETRHSIYIRTVHCSFLVPGNTQKILTEI